MHDSLLRAQWLQKFSCTCLKLHTKHLRCCNVFRAANHQHRHRPRLPVNDPFQWFHRGNFGDHIPQCAVQATCRIAHTPASVMFGHLHPDNSRKYQIHIFILWSLRQMTNELTALDTSSCLALGILAQISEKGPICN